MKQKIRIVAFFLLAAAIIWPPSALAGPKYLFKIASVAPEGSVWTSRFRDFAAEVREKSNGEVGFKVYPGGVMGDDRAMYRKMRVGQLHGGGFTMTGIGPVVPDFRVMGIPFLFKSHAEVDLVRDGLSARFHQAFADQGLELVAMTEVGFVYTMSTSPISSVAELKASKAWAPESDPVSAAFLESLGVSPTPLAIPDVLSSLQTGLIDTVFNSLYGSIVLQWFSKAKYITDVPFGYAYGAFLLDRKKYLRLQPQHAQLIKTAADKYFTALIEDTRKSNMEALDVLQQNGATLIPLAEGTLVELEATRDKAMKNLSGEAFSRDIYDQVMKLLADYRAR